MNEEEKNRILLAGQVATEDSPAQAVKYPDKPSGMDDDRYEWLINHVENPQAISSAFDPNYDPLRDGGFMTRIMELNKSKEIDEKKVEQARVAASIGDTVSILARMFGASRGAPVSRRDPGQFAMTRFANEEKALRDIYRQKTDRYNDQVAAAKAADASRSYADRQKNINYIRDVLAQKTRQDYNIAKDEATARERALSRSETQRYHDAQLRQGEERNRISAQRVMNSGKGSSGKSGKSGKTEIIDINARSSDTKAVKDKMGNKVLRYEFSESEYKNYLNDAKKKALTDKDWLKDHPEVVISSPKIVGRGANTHKEGAYKFDEHLLVETYIQDLYDSAGNTGTADRAAEKSGSTNGWY
jgi:hypothetical protein